jgi:hypothetical protein
VNVLLYVIGIMKLSSKHLNLSLLWLSLTHDIIIQTMMIVKQKAGSGFSLLYAHKSAESDIASWENWFLLNQENRYERN